MSDVDAGASAPGDAGSLPETNVETSRPIMTEREPEAAPEANEPDKPVKPEAKDKNAEVEPKKPLTTRQALEKATKEIATRDDKTAERPAKPVAAKEAPLKTGETEVRADQTGNKDAKPAEDIARAPQQQNNTPPVRNEAPARFSADAKAAWESAPESVRAETNRAIRELTQGFEKHRVAAERDSTLGEFHEMATKSGKELHGVVREYVNMENLLRQDPVSGLDTLCNRMGFSLRDIAAHVMGQNPDQVRSQQDNTIRNLEAQVRTLSSQIGGVTQNIQQRQQDAVLQNVAEFAAKPENSRFEELADDIAFFMQTGRATDIAQAYEMADRLNPAPDVPGNRKPAASSAAAPDLTAQTDKGQKSIQGSPSHGSTPRKVPSSSIKESLKRAVAQAG